MPKTHDERITELEAKLAALDKTPTLKKHAGTDDFSKVTKTPRKIHDVPANEKPNLLIGIKAKLHDGHALYEAYKKYKYAGIPRIRGSK